MSEPRNEGVADPPLTIENRKEDHHLQVVLLSKDKGNSLDENTQMLVNDIEQFF